MINDLLLLPPLSDGPPRVPSNVPGTVPPAIQVGQPGAPQGHSGSRAQLRPFPRPTFEYIVDVERASQVCGQLALAPKVALDIETFGRVSPRDKDDKPALDPFRNRVRLVQLAVEPSHGYAFDMERLGGAPPALRALLSGGRTAIIGFNLAFDALNLLHHYGIAIGFPIDLLAGAILAEGYAHWGDKRKAKDDERGWYKLEAVVARYLGLVLDKEQQLSDWSRSQLSTEQLSYAITDAAVLLLLYERIAASAEDAGVASAWDIENDVTVPLAATSLAGIRVDRRRVRRLGTTWAKSAMRAGSQALVELGRDPEDPQGLALLDEIDLDSPLKLRAILAERLGIRVDDTKESTLNELAARHASIAKIVEYRGYRKRVSTYAQKWLEVSESNGRIHATFRSMAAPTGRMGCQSPNIQSVPRDPRVRRCFVPEPGCLFVVADYHAIELRVVAQLIGDRELVDCFCAEPQIDPHRRTAASILKKPVDEVSDDDRANAKAVNFGFIYSLGPDGFVRYARDEYGKDFTPREARVLRQKFFGLYRGIAAWHRTAQYEGRRTMRAVTASGRYRLFDEFNLAEFLNTPVQGTAADGMKRALALLYPQLGPLGARVVNVIHDEIVVEVPVNNADQAKVVVEQCMVSGMQEFLPDIPVVVEPVVASWWRKP
jgi:DNA polymerase-1